MAFDYKERTPDFMRMIYLCENFLCINGINDYRDGDLPFHENRRDGDIRLFFI